MTPASYTNIRDDVDESSPNLMGGENDSSDTSGNFDCNICLEESQAPVVTMCGHLFCWSCIHRWITMHSELEECPVCKACIKDKIVPLYGRGKTEVANHGPKKIHRLARLHGAPYYPSTAPNVLQNAGYPYVGQQSYGFVAQQNYGLQGACFTSSAVAFGLFPALFGVYGSTVTLENDGHRFRNSVSSMAFQHLHVNREQEFILYWFLILLAGFTISCLLLF